MSLLCPVPFHFNAVTALCPHTKRSRTLERELRPGCFYSLLWATTNQIQNQISRCQTNVKDESNTDEKQTISSNNFLYYTISLGIHGRIPLGPGHRFALLQHAAIQGALVPVQRHSFRLLPVQEPADAEAQHWHAGPQVLPSYS